MHILAATSASLDELTAPVDLRQEPADIVALSFNDGDLAGLAAAWRADAATLPSLRLARLRDLAHPMSVDLWIDRIGAHAKVILVRVLGGHEWWRYGCERLAAVARERGIKLALLPGECRDEDLRLVEGSTLRRAELDGLLACFREGGPANMRVLMRRLAGLAGDESSEPPPPPVEPVAHHGCWDPESGVADIDLLTAGADPAAPLVPILFYRSMLLAGDTDPVAAIAAALRARGILPVPMFVQSLKSAESAAFVGSALRRFPPSVVVACTAFASCEAGGQTLFDRAGVPVLQAAIATTRREAWESGGRGLAPADLAMHVVLPELDGRLFAGIVSLKAERDEDDALGLRGLVNRPEPDRVEHVADRVGNLVRLQRTPRSERRVVVLMPDYPGAPGRTGYAVGLDVPASVLAMLVDLADAGYRVADVPATPRALLDALEGGEGALPFEAYTASLAAFPAAAMSAVQAAWGDPAVDPLMHVGAFRFRAARFGNVTVALAPDRGRTADRRAEYHDPALPPRHALLAFGLWMRTVVDAHAIVHVGAHGTLEWLPGKTVALSANCFPEIVAGALPVVYPFIVSNPGEAAQAKRRIAAVTLGHLSPPLAMAGLDEERSKLERLVDEYAQSDGLHRARRERLGKLIVETAVRSGLAADAGIGADADVPDALRRIDAWLCDLKDLAVKDGLHVYGRASPGEADPLRLSSADTERSALLAALDGRHVAAGPAGAPARGRRDVLPTGRNLHTADPRGLPTPTAYDLGGLAAEEILRRYRQDHGDWPASLVMDLWGSASLRTGGEEIAQGLALMGCRPVWDHATARVTGIEVMPLAVLGRPRVDVTWRISGLFRDLFPAQIALLDAAAKAIAAREGEAEDNPLAAAKAAGKPPSRVFGSAPGSYGAGIEEMQASGAWDTREELGRAYLDAASHAYGGAEGAGAAAFGAFADRVAIADILVHAGDDPGRDLLEGSADAAFIGGFAAAAAALGARADLVALDTTDPARPRARSVTGAVTRIVRARAVNPRFIAGQLRHGPRGAAELAETVDRLVGFAELTHAVPPALIEAVYVAYVEDERVRAFLLRENPQAARHIACRFADARRRGLWHPLRNSVETQLAEMIAASPALEEAA